MDSSSSTGNSGWPTKAGAMSDLTPAGESGTSMPTEPSSHGRGGGPLSNLRKAYQVFRELLTPRPTVSRRSQLPYKSPKFVDAQASWHLALDWLTRLTRGLHLEELSAPVFDRHGGFDRLEVRRLSPAAGSDRSKPRPPDLRDRILRLTGSGDLLRALSDRLLLLGAGAACGGEAGGQRGGQPPAPRLDLLQLPLTFESATGHQHSGAQHAHHLPHLRHHPHPHCSHLPAHAQAGINSCEENLATFHRFLARVLTCPGADETGTCEMRIALGKQCAECSAAGLLLRHQLQPQHPQPKEQRRSQRKNKKTSSQREPSDGDSDDIDSALSVLLLHLLTLMLLLDEPVPAKQRAEVLLLWEHRLQPDTLAASPIVLEMRKRYAELMIGGQ